MRKINVECHVLDIDTKLKENGFTYIGTYNNKYDHYVEDKSNKTYYINKFQDYTLYQQEFEGKYCWIEYVMLNNVKSKKELTMVDMSLRGITENMILINDKLLTNEELQIRIKYLENRIDEIEKHFSIGKYDNGLNDLPF